MQTLQELMLLKHDNGICCYDTKKRTHFYSTYTITNKIHTWSHGNGFSHYMYNNYSQLHAQNKFYGIHQLNYLKAFFYIQITTTHGDCARSSLRCTTILNVPQLSKSVVHTHIMTIILHLNLSSSTAEFLYMCKNIWISTIQKIILHDSFKKKTKVLDQVWHN